MRHNKALALALTAGLGWALMAGSQATTKSAGPTAGGDKKLFAQLMAEGAAEFPKICAMCHGPEGAGLMFLQMEADEIRMLSDALSRNPYADRQR